MSKKRNIWHGNVRDAALSILMAVQEKQAYSNLLLHRTIEMYQLEEKDRALLTELTYGTLQHRMTLDYYLEPFVRGKLDGWVRELLRLSIYQIVYLTKIPSHAVVHEAVEIAKRRGHKGIASTVNGILRSFLREGARSVDTITDGVRKIAIETSHPEWLIQRWVDAFGFETANAIAHENNKPAKLTMRVNTTKATVEEVREMLKTEGVETEFGKIVPECIYSVSGNPIATTTFQKGYVTIQDESSMLPVQALQVEPGMRVLDMCSAPGGKTTQIAEKMNDEGQVFAHDLHAHKMKLITNNAKRLGLTSIETKSGDSRKLTEIYPAQSFDRILVDAPCSGLGVIRRKPEIKYTKTAEDFSTLAAIQIELLNTASELIKPGGIVVYSTCTIERIENEEVVQLFLNRHPEMERFPLTSLSIFKDLSIQDDMLHVLPQDFGGDGFFVAAFRKK